MGLLWDCAKCRAKSLLQLHCPKIPLCGMARQEEGGMKSLRYLMGTMGSSAAIAVSCFWHSTLVLGCCGGLWGLLKGKHLPHARGGG